MGRAGERIAVAVRNTTRIDSLTRTANYRIPDYLTPKVLGEVKNVAYQSLTNQITDMLLFAEANGLSMVLTVRKTTQFSSDLQALVSAGRIIVNRLL
jgi:hypothetical protein